MKFRSIIRLSLLVAVLTIELFGIHATSHAQVVTTGDVTPFPWNSGTNIFVGANATGAVTIAQATVNNRLSYLGFNSGSNGSPSVLQTHESLF
jgi:hypothetical protein